jgi:ATP-dependent exoDNAse (exonuclease V) beta subunit
MSTKTPPDFLQKLNHHKRDDHITFDEGPHIYTIDGDSGFTSVTTWVHSHFSHFDPDKVINNMFSSGKINDPTYKYFGMTKDQIKKQWSGGEAAQKGTDMHYDIECFYNNIDVNNSTEEFSYFINFKNDYNNLNAYRTEWLVYYEELRLAGSIDMVFKDENGDFWVYDWKRTGELSPESFKDKRATNSIINNIPDCKYWHYALQLNIYRTILEENYHLKIKGMCLVRLHPDNVYKNYERIPVPFLNDEVQLLFNQRRQQIVDSN